MMTRKDHVQLLTSKSSASTEGGCSFVFSVFDAFLTTLFPVENNENNSMIIITNVQDDYLEYSSIPGCLTRITLP